MAAPRLPDHGAKDVAAPGGTRIIVVKTEPGDAHALRQARPFIFPRYHLNKKHWITVVAPGEVASDGADSPDDDARRQPPPAPDVAPAAVTGINETAF